MDRPPFNRNLQLVLLAIFWLGLLMFAIITDAERAYEKDIASPTPTQVRPTAKFW